MPITLRYDQGRCCSLRAILLFMVSLSTVELVFRRQLVLWRSIVYPGHPFPLKGNFYASIFIHFEPTGHTIGKDESGFFYVKEEGQKKSSWSNGHKGRMDANREYVSNVQQGFGGQSSSYEGGLPPYIKSAYIDGSICWSLANLN